VCLGKSAVVPDREGSGAHGGWVDGRRLSVTLEKHPRGSSMHRGPAPSNAPGCCFSCLHRCPVRASTGFLANPDPVKRFKSSLEVTGPMKNELIIEAALFSAGRALDAGEISEATGLRKPEIRTAVRKLMRRYRKAETSLEVVKIGSKYSMQLKTDYGEHARKLARADIPGKLLKTLALIAYHQPLRQSKLREMIGDKVYDHVKELHELRLVRAVRDGRTKLLYTTKLFPEYFGIDATKKDAIKRYLAKRAGIEEIMAAERERSGEENIEEDGEKEIPGKAGNGEGNDEEEIPDKAGNGEGNDEKEIPDKAGNGEGNDEKEIPDKAGNGEGNDEEEIPGQGRKRGRK